jgi:holo-[acyl-carrier protein] synthase
MPLLAHGIDLTEVARIGRMVAEHGEKFLERCFTERERAYAGDRKRRDEHLAARFAAKEAVLKALGTGWSSGIAWTDVEVVLLPRGQPTVSLSGRAAEVAASLGITTWFLSLTHTETHAMASVIATRP